MVTMMTFWPHCQQRLLVQRKNRKRRVETRPQETLPMSLQLSWGADGMTGGRWVPVQITYCLVLSMFILPLSQQIYSCF